MRRTLSPGGRADARLEHQIPDIDKAGRSFLEAIVDAARDGFVVQDAAGKIILCNASAARMLGLDRAGIVGKTSQDLEAGIVREDGTPFPAEEHPSMMTLRTGQPSHDVVLGIRNNPDDPRWLSVTSVPLPGDDAGTKWVFTVLSDITARVESARRLAETSDQLRESNESLLKAQAQARAILQAIPDLLWLKDLRGTYLECNPEFARYLDTDVSQIVGKTDYDFECPSEADAFRQSDYEASVSSAPVRSEATLVYKNDGRRSMVETIKTPMRDLSGEVVGVLGIGRDVTYRRALEQQLRRSVAELEQLNATIETLSRTDPLTMLANRRQLAEVMQAEFLRSRRHGTATAVLMIDIDDFKAVNDKHGHEVGDRALVALASVLKATVRVYDLPARFGGEEFVVLLPHTSLAGAVEIAERIRSAIARVAVVSPGCELWLTVSIGVTASLAGDLDWTAAVARADRAMYRAKASGRNRVEVEG